jgi:nucleoside diphosphate kinase
MDRLLLSSVKPEDLEHVNAIQRGLSNLPLLFRREVLGPIAEKIMANQDDPAVEFQGFLHLLKDNSGPFNERLAEAQIDLPQHVTKLVRSGSLTLAMIKPRANTYDTEGLSDWQVASRIIDAITSPTTYRSVDGQDNATLPLKSLGALSIVPSRRFVDEFYDGEPKQQQMDVPPARFHGFANRWEEYLDLMTTGPATLVTLYDPDGNAVDKARSIQGHWNPKKNDNPFSIRARFAGGWSGNVKGDTYNSVTHTSDSPDSALREFGIWYRYITQQ